MNYEFKGTPGPWFYNGMTLGKHWVIVDEGGDGSTDVKTVCKFSPLDREDYETNQQWIEATGNAHLIAAAPCLLQVAINALNDMQNIVPASPARDNRIEQIKLAIHKALNIK